jgi:hypothetical protein
MVDDEAPCATLADLDADLVQPLVSSSHLQYLCDMFITHTHTHTHTHVLTLITLV